MKSRRNLPSIAFLVFVLTILFFHNSFSVVGNQEGEDISKGNNNVESESVIDSPIIEEVKQPIELYLSGIEREELEILEDSYSVLNYEASFASFEYPGSWNVRESQDSFIPHVQIANYDSGKVDTLHLRNNPYFKIEIYKLKNINNLPLKEWVDEYNSHQEYSIEILTEENIVVDRKESLQQVKKNLNYNFAYLSVYIFNKESIYMIVTNSMPGFESKFSDILESLRIKE